MATTTTKKKKTNRAYRQAASTSNVPQVPNFDPGAYQTLPYYPSPGLPSRPSVGRSSPSRTTQPVDGPLPLGPAQLGPGSARPYLSPLAQPGPSRAILPVFQYPLDLTGGGLGHLLQPLANRPVQNYSFMRPEVIQALGSNPQAAELISRLGAFLQG